MEASAGLIAGSHKRNELLVIGTDTGAKKPLRSSRTEYPCKICGDELGVGPEGEPFVACDECGFPVCRSCYEYERMEGSQCCPKCRIRYKRKKGSVRVEGDEEEDDVDDLDNEFNFEKQNRERLVAESMLHGQMSYGRGDDQDISYATHTMKPQVPLLTDGSSVCEDYNGIPRDSHALVVPPFMGGGNNFSYYSGQPRPLDPSKDLTAYGFGSVTWRENLKANQEQMQMVPKDSGGNGQDDTDLPVTDESRQPLSRKVPIPSSRINPYRMIIIIRLVVLAFFLRYRLLNPVPDAIAIWLISVICEIWFALSWILDQFPKWLPINRETYLDRLSLRYERDGKPSQLAAVDIFVSTVDPMKEPPIVTANTVLSILAVDYPVDKVSCYVSDDGAAMLSFEALSETTKFAKEWVPFCKKYNIEPRAPEMYFAKKIDYLKDKVHTSFIKERRAVKREYEEFKVRMNGLVAKAQKVPEEGWTMQDGTPWPGNNVRDHPGMIQVFLGHSGGPDKAGNELPRLVYVSREKRPGYNHHKKAGAMNALIRVSAALTNAPYILNLDCDHYINNSKAFREAMCFMMDPAVGKRVCYVQFPQRFDGIDLHDRYANNNTVFFDINLRGLDGIQGPVYVGTGCVFRRQALYGNDAPRKDGFTLQSCCPSWLCGGGSRKKGKKLKLKFRNSDKKKKSFSSSKELSNPGFFKLDKSEQGMMDYGNEDSAQGKLEKKLGRSPLFIASTFLENGGVPKGVSPAALLKEALHSISCGYEDKTEWGKEVGWIYGSVTEDILTGFKMHVRGWRSIYCMPERPAFKGSAPINLTDRLHQVLRWALGSVEILFSRHCPIWYGYGRGLKVLERLAYINTIVYPLTSLPLLAYCALPAVCLLTGKFIMPSMSGFGSLWFMALFISIAVTGILEMRWSGVGIDDWWRNEQFWVIGGVSAHFFALLQGLLKVLAGIDTNFTVTSKAGSSDEEGAEFAELYAIKWTTLLIPPTTLLIFNLVGVVAGVSDAVNNGYDSWGPLFGKVFFAIWVILHLYPFLKGLMGRQNRTPTIVVVWSILLASIFSLLWVRIDPFTTKEVTPALEVCGLSCD